MQRRIFDFLVVTVFFLGLLAPALTFLSGMRARQFEDRPMAERPAFATNRIFDPKFYAELDAYLTDLNPIREKAVNTTARLAYYLFHDSSTKQVVAGKDGWMFLREEFSYRCADQAALDQQYANLAALGHALEKAGVKFVVSISPNKSSIYPENLTSAGTALAACARENRARLRALFSRGDVNFIDMWTTIEDRKKTSSEPLYVPDESHWTQFGSALFVAELARRYAPELSWKNPRQTMIDTTLPDISRMAGISLPRDMPVIEFDRDSKYNRQSTSIPHGEPGRDYVLNRSVSAPAPLSKRRILFLHDSFMYVAWDQVAQFFGDAFYMHWSSLTPERFAALASTADVVVIQMVERGTVDRMEYYFSDAKYADAVNALAKGPKPDLSSIWPAPAAQ